ncbi:hypothetical protein [Streptomyces sp. NPDC050548]|uniref:hypothetical protein n=1 Tax=Streptomyces sp. NPDC050548 TaxID=3365629 RepID=UPI003793B7AF
MARADVFRRERGVGGGFLRGPVRRAEAAAPAAERLMWLDQVIDPVVTAVTGVFART